MSQKLLLLEIGGTNCRIIWGQLQAGKFVILVDPYKLTHEGKLSAAEMLARYVQSRGGDVLSDLGRVYIAAAGAFDPGESLIRLTKYKDGAIKLVEVAEACSVTLDDIVVLNDLEAADYALPFLADNEVVPVLGPDRDRFACTAGAKLLLFMGTGLGVCVLNPDGRVLATEAGNIPVPDLGPHPSVDTLSLSFRNSLEKIRTDSLRVESLLSGPGIADTYQAISQERTPLPPEKVGELLISVPERRSAAALMTLELLATVLGRFLATLKLCYWGVTEIYVGGLLDTIPDIVEHRLFAITFLNPPAHKQAFSNVRVLRLAAPDLPMRGLIRYVESELS